MVPAEGNGFGAGVEASHGAGAMVREIRRAVTGTRAGIEHVGIVTERQREVVDRAVRDEAVIGKQMR